MKRYVFIGSVDYSAYCLRSLLGMGVNIVDIMCPVKEVSGFNSDYCDLGEIAGEFGKDVYYFKKIRNEAERIRQAKPDVIFILGLSQIVPPQILEIPSIGCIGSHPAMLPQNRGRHPIIWAIANGLTKSGITLFWLDEGVDSGDIWAQEEFEIGVEDDALSIYKKVERLTVKLLEENVPDLEKGYVKRIKQDNSRVNVWRKRTYKDGEIDWRMSSKRIFDLVRALTKPYVGAHCIYTGKEVKIWKSRIINGTENMVNLEPGKIVSVNGSHVRVKTGDGVIEITQHDFNPLPATGEYL